MNDKDVMPNTMLANHISSVVFATIAMSIPVTIPMRFNTNHQDQLYCDIILIVNAVTAVEHFLCYLCCFNTFIEGNLNEELLVVRVADVVLPLNIIATVGITVLISRFARGEHYCSH